MSTGHLERSSQLVVLDEKPITLDDLPERLKREVRATEDEASVRALSLLWAGAEDAVADRLLNEEAERLGQSVSEFVDEQITRHVGTPSDAELRDLFLTGAKHAPQKPLSLDVERARWRENRVEALRRNRVDQLRETHSIRYAFAPLTLFRHQVPAFGPSRGTQNSLVELVAFSDFTCPYSAHMRRLLDALEKDYPDVLRIVHQDFPLGQQNAAWALSKAGVCAQAQGKFWQLFALLFDGHAHTSQVELDQAIRLAGLDPEKTASCMLLDATADQVAKSIALGQSLNVRATPTLFLNGMRLTGVLPQPLMRHLIDQELALKAKSSKSKGFP